ncbi:hypothetical protein M9H77_29505 [Catharanthus roseus]|uniref:Uncharacterized protein n=1 Tax=Catharanthus roseus TaxID=4058 RepID=A0ACB9ZUM4_CATRO|nr:hypothetical protein M9H77_29505 [Catharanthus roseus]
MGNGYQFYFLNSLGILLEKKQFIDFNSLSCAISRVDEYHFNIANYASCVLGIEDKGRSMEKELGTILEEFPISLSLIPSLFQGFNDEGQVSKLLIIYTISKDYLMEQFGWKMSKCFEVLDLPTMRNDERKQKRSENDKKKVDGVPEQHVISGQKPIGGGRLPLPSMVILLLGKERVLGGQDLKIQFQDFELHLDNSRDDPGRRSGLIRLIARMLGIEKTKH